MTAKTLALVLVAALSTAAGAQTWSRFYEAGLASARAGRWSEARGDFLQAAAGRTEDQATPTILPGPATERKLWRNGAPYSPNFLAAYARYRESLLTGDPTESAKTMREAASEFETLVEKGQTSPEAFFFLDVVYTKLGDADKRQATADRMAKTKPTFKVDTEPLAPEELGALGARTTAPGTGVPLLNGTTGVAVTPGAPFGAGPKVKVGGIVAALPDKYALVIGESDVRIASAALPFAANDAQRVRDSLISFAGYPAENVKMLQNVSASAIKTAADALAAIIGENATVTIYYAGTGVNLAGKDYLAGTDTDSASDATRMLAKTDLFMPFVQRGARVFAFFEANRPIDSRGAFFGRESVGIGSISQVQSTRPGDVCTITYEGGQAVGLFTNAFVSTLSDLRANRVPIGEFVWQVVNGMRRGNTGTTGGGGTQICTLPVMTGMASDAKF